MEGKKAFSSSNLAESNTLSSQKSDIIWKGSDIDLLGDSLITDKTTASINSDTAGNVKVVCRFWPLNQKEAR